MKIRITAAAVILATGMAAAQSAAPLDVATTTNGNLVELSSITIDRGFGQESIDAADLINIEVLSISTSEAPFEGTLAATPAGSGTPVSGQRAALLEDLGLNTALQNPNGTSGLGFRFVNDSGESASVFNGVGADLVIFDIGLAEGAPVPGPVGTMNFSQGFDPFSLAGVGSFSGNSADFLTPEFLTVNGPGAFGGITDFFNAPGLTPLSSLSELENVQLSQIPFPQTPPITVFATTIDLSDLGFAYGEEVSELTLLKLGDLFAVDPALIAGLPPVPAPGGALVLVAGGALAARRRR
ncbi:MAG: hypothetical protein AAGI17_00575 [Planctomycetota bacterium]